MDEAEEAQLKSDAEEIEAMLHTRGWQLVRAKLDEEILDLQNINNIDTSDPATMQIDLRGRVLAFRLLVDFLKNDVYGFVEQQRQAQEASSDNKATESFINRQ